MIIIVPIIVPTPWTYQVAQSLQIVRNVNAGTIPSGWRFSLAGMRVHLSKALFLPESVNLLKKKTVFLDLRLHPGSSQSYLKGVSLVIEKNAKGCA